MSRQLVVLLAMLGSCQCGSEADVLPTYRERERNVCPRSPGAIAGDPGVTVALHPRVSEHSLQLEYTLTNGSALPILAFDRGDAHSGRYDPNFAYVRVSGTALIVERAVEIAQFDYFHNRVPYASEVPVGHSVTRAFAIARPVGEYLDGRLIREHGSIRVTSIHLVVGWIPRESWWPLPPDATVPAGTIEIVAGESLWSIHQPFAAYEQRLSVSASHPIDLTVERRDFR